MKYIYVTLLLIIVLSNGYSQFVGDPWKDGTWKYPVYITDSIYRLNAYRLHYDLRGKSQNTIIAIPNNRMSGYSITMPAGAK